MVAKAKTTTGQEKAQEDISLCQTGTLLVIPHARGHVQAARPNMKAGMMQPLTGSRDEDGWRLSLIASFRKVRRSNPLSSNGSTAWPSSILTKEPESWYQKAG